MKALLASTAIVRAGLAAFAASTLIAVAPVLAAGGDGGGNPGSGGADSTTSVGGNGTAGGAAGQGGGGGGAGIGPGGIGPGGGVGGVGGNGAAGGTAGTHTTPGGDGDPGAAAGDGGGGGGGGGLAVNAPFGTTIFGNFTAGAGGRGGDGNGTGAGGGGGAGGVNIILGSGTADIGATNQRLGGAGGAGGASAAGLGGSGGSGGAGIIALSGTVNMNPGSLVGGGAGGAGGVGGAGTGVGGAGGAGISATSATINNDGAAISGGSGGAGSTNGAGGSGIIGQDLAIVTSGSISGGLAGDGVTRANAISFTGGTNTLQFGNATSGLTGAISVTGSVDFNQAATSTTVSNNIIGTGSVIKSNSGIITLSGTSTYTGGTTINAGTLAVTDDANLGNVAGVLTFNGGTLRVSTNGGPVVVIARDVSLQAGGGTVEAEIGTILSGQITGAGSLTKTGSEILSLFGTNTYTGATNVMSGQLQSDSAGAFSAASAFTVAAGAAIELRGSQQSIGSLAGAGAVTNFNVAAATLTTGFDNSSTTFSGVMSDNVGLLSLVKVGSGTQTLSGVNTYGGTTTVNGGTLAVNGSIATSSLTTVNAGGTLGGTGTVGNITINGGTLSPGNSIGTLAVAGNLVFTAAASYMVEVSPASSDRTNVTGAATLGGATVKASFAAGTYVVKQYTILNATGGLAGSTFGSVVNTNLPGGFTSSLSYDANNAYLNLALAFVPPPGTGLSINQQNVGNAIVNFFNTTGGIPIVFGGLTPVGLTQISGETATGSQQATFDAMNLFMGLMTDPFTGGRGGSAPGASGFAEEHNANAYAANGRKLSGAEREAYAMFTKAPPSAFEGRWNVWAAGFGGSQTTDGNATLGSNTATSRVGGVAVGADYWLSPQTVAGFAVAGGGTNFSVNGAGSGRSDLFQAGAFVRHTIGSAYITAAAAYGWQDITTDRTVTVAGVDQLRAQFNANAFSGRVEGGNRYVLPWMRGIGLTPYAAVQATAFDLPGYGESVVSGANTFALAYAAKTVTATRSELGLRTDKSWAMPDSIFTLRGRFAWAHDYNTDRSIGATFQTLPGASFVVNGAAQSPDKALTTGSAEVKWRNGLSLAATFEGEFSGNSTSYAGKGVARYTW